METRNISIDGWKGIVVLTAKGDRPVVRIEVPFVSEAGALQFIENMHTHCLIFDKED